MFRALLIFLFFGASTLHAQEITRTLTTGFVYNENGRFAFSVDVTLVPFSSTLHKQRYFGADGGDPQFVPSAFDFALNERSIKIPRKAISDLGDIRSVSPPSDIENDLWMITVIGGDAGGSYKVELVFDSTKLIERRFVDLYSPASERRIIKSQKY